MAWSLSKLVAALTGSNGVAAPMSLETAMSIPAIQYTVGRVTSHAARLPLFIHRKTEPRGAVKAVDHWAYELIKTAPNAIQSYINFREQLFLHAIMVGNGRAVLFNRGQRSAELVILNPADCDTVLVNGLKFHVYIPDKDERLSVWESLLDKPKEAIVYDDSDVIHIHRFGANGISGEGLAKRMRRSLGLTVKQDDFAYNQTSKGFAAKLIVEAPPGMLRNEKDAKEFINAFNEANSSEKNAGKAALVREGMKVQTVNMSNADSEFLEQRRFSRQDVALMMGFDGVPGDGESHSYNSKEMEALNYLDNALAPWTCLLEAEVDRKILSPQDRRTGHYSRYNYSALLRTDAATQASVLSTYIACRVYSPNDAREKLDENPYSGGDAYENPAISPGNPGVKEAKPAQKPSNLTDSAATASLKAFIRTEINNAKNGANRPDFCGWIDKNYAKWEQKMADRLEELGLDRDLASQYCKDSTEMLLNVAGESTPEQLKDNVAKCVATWEDRVYQLLEEVAHA